MNKILGIIIGVIAIVFVIFLLVGKGDTTTVAQKTDTTNNTTDNTAQTTGNTVVAGVPVAVTAQKTFPTDTTVVMTGSVTPNGALTSYWYEYGTDKDMSKKTDRQMLGSGFNTISAPSYVTGLTKDTTYYFRLNAENQFGKVSGSQYTFVTTHDVPAPLGSAPTTKTVGASGIARTTATLNGEVTPNKASTQYWFEYGESANLGSVSPIVAPSDKVTKITPTLAISDLKPLTTYYFRINAQNQFGTVNGSILTFKTNGPASPANPTVSLVSASEITATTATVRGSVNPLGANTSYWFEYSTDPGFAESKLNSTEHASAGQDLGNVSVKSDLKNLSPKTTYYFRVVAENIAGTVRSESSSFKTK